MLRMSTKSRRGTVTVELALVLPIIFAILLGSIDLARANMIRNTLDNAAFESARFATIPGATTAEISATAQSVLDVLGIENAVIAVTPSIITDSTEQVTVSISVDLGPNLYASSQFLRGKTIVKSCTLTREQFAVEILE